MNSSGWGVGSTSGSFLWDTMAAGYSVSFSFTFCNVPVELAASAPLKGSRARAGSLVTASASKASCFLGDRALLGEGGALHGDEVPPLPLAAHMANEPYGNMRSFFPLHP